jgi:hypothetical protein
MLPYLQTACKDLLPGVVGASSASAAAFLGARAGFIDIQGIALKLLAIHAGNGRQGVFLGRHLHKAESSRLAGEFVLDNVDGRNLAEAFILLSTFVYLLKILFSRWSCGTR